jgi:rare lipoprotein A (peptidoglycan hydrolase)
MDESWTFLNAAAKQLGMLQDGVSTIQLEVVGQDRFETDVNASGGANGQKARDTGETVRCRLSSNCLHHM